ncbi:hypothetical protein MGAS9429_Spy0884 [Streptococcus pyogenes MGAS9429]|uniref:Uncharacterized protein n=1 Tax=Streptococcus pyogenes serotype M12 (strain MGAS9429) TaxID=370551 RepID=Q1JLZ7_STRPC|nr:hypothetical protein MGAS9429_Spy0884 [Streptococcus pyogenes MGAS9429]
MKRYFEKEKLKHIKPISEVIKTISEIIKLIMDLI